MGHGPDGYQYNKKAPLAQPAGLLAMTAKAYKDRCLLITLVCVRTGRSPALVPQGDTWATCPHLSGVLFALRERAGEIMAEHTGWPARRALFGALCSIAVAGGTPAFCLTT